MSILAIDTVGAGSSIAIIEYDGNCFIGHNSASNNHAESFFQILDTLFNKHTYNYDKIDHLAVVVGPGSFTGIRVGVSSAKGISLATNKPLYGVSALEIQAYAISLLHANNKKNIRSIIKNTQGSYTQLFDCSLLQLSGPEMIDENELSHSDCITYLDPSVSYSDDTGIQPKLNASHAGLLVRYRLKNKQNLNDAEPLYLSEPQYMKSL
ncbi:tRNA (adenosine(37)-N6)-threonylcarbamoyltransferase complex dimerization subunit type 1 TsaB [Wolbachia endosymbiont of Folsomia candida]|uniref:tRNA (adenosine(37)-N6)-threonylcarbamoyltransferase complex dimerization subunit type 1 TsaB n=1 Tax=Wolbachia endosymbiont of Folsomia candida TaxID=169402 RepID=UPI000AA7AED1|nr:tRNA (adenosine(37)-N6)-threonylcarbamoyltransferase complex dimerization subunit type 1 TsaB [Wolbachia endosymbiont of Folsomia candida]APR99076.1 tRNA (adenosine(37)-N6)-threonylcarbamoyltransferase complex dimerization subunit type 1 TsaB [Wolbachia endosymbiont of Folsomia candida]